MQATSSRSAPISPAVYALELFDTILERLAIAQATEQDILPYLKLAARTAGIIAQQARFEASLQEPAQAAFTRIIALAEVADQAATQANPAALGYLTVITGCLAWLARLENAARKDAQQAARRETAQASPAIPESHALEPLPVTAPQPVKPVVAPPHAVAAKLIATLTRHSAGMMDTLAAEHSAFP